MQRAIYFFFAVLRAMAIKENTQKGSEVKPFEFALTIIT